MRKILISALVLIAGISLTVWAGGAIWRIGLWADASGTSGDPGVLLWLAAIAGVAAVVVGVGMLARAIVLAITHSSSQGVVEPTHR